MPKKTTPKKCLAFEYKIIPSTANQWVLIRKNEFFSQKEQCTIFFKGHFWLIDQDTENVILKSLQTFYATDVKVKNVSFQLIWEMKSWFFVQIKTTFSPLSDFTTFSRLTTFYDWQSLFEESLNAPTYLYTFLRVHKGEIIAEIITPFMR